MYRLSAFTYLFIVLSSLMLSACGGSNSSDSETKAAVDDISNVTFSGKIVGPDGQTPLIRATVYVPDNAEARLAQVHSVSAKTTALESNVLGVDCPLPQEPYLVGVCTSDDGSFNFFSQSFSGELKAFKGVFSASFDLDLVDGESVDLGNVLVSVGNTSQSNIAVVTGDYDFIENLLAKSGLGDIDSDGYLIQGTEDFDLYDGNASLGIEYPGFSALFDDRGDGLPKLHNYSIVFINCGANEYDNEFGVDPGGVVTVNALRNYVELGGRLYATDLAYDYVEQAFPEFIDFMGSEDIPADEPEYLDEAEQGLSGIEVPNATILNENLTAFLSNLNCQNGENCLNEDGTVYLEGFLSGWSIMEGTHNNNSNTEFIVQGSIDMGLSENSIKPLTAVISVGEGKVMYSSYHTEDLGSNEFLPQERVLQFLVFE